MIIKAMLKKLVYVLTTSFLSFYSTGLAVS